jgi:2-keto-4-pentenoate hydratase
VADADPRLLAALRRQLERRDEIVSDGASQLGWKLGIGAAESIGGEIAVGHLTSATLLEPGESFRAGDATMLHADAEIAVELGGDIEPGAGEAAVAAAIRGYRPALEIVDLAGDEEAEEAIAGNVFHRALALGELRPGLAGALGAQLVLNGEIRKEARAPADLAPRLAAAARVLAAVGERIQTGAVVITGNVVQVPVAAGDEVTAAFGSLGSVSLRIAA